MGPPVLDASCAVASVLGELTTTPRADAALRRVVQDRVIVPAVFWYEVRHALVRARRRGRIDAGGFVSARKELAAIKTEADAGHDERAVFALVDRYSMSFYDACYLETAIRRGVALAAVDQKLLAAAVAEGIPTLVGATP